jgi:hypothetical protein
MALAAEKFIRLTCPLPVSLPLIQEDDQRGAVDEVRLPLVYQGKAIPNPVQNSVFMQTEKVGYLPNGI